VRETASIVLEGLRWVLLGIASLATLAAAQVKRAQEKLDHGS
jgi:hypothetical protein